jgi:predicted DNA-binding transcriptional regulator YafY
VRPNLEILAAITRALYARKPLKITYVSLSSGPSTRVIVPVALADNGLRWHVRAFDRSKSRFSDFVLTRITKTKDIQEGAEEHELLAADEQWARIVDLEIVPHPGVKWPAAVEADYAMDRGVLKLRTRAALAGYVLRRWSVDSSANHSLDPASHHLWLSNSLALYGVESATLAPGVTSSPINDSTA